MATMKSAHSSLASLTFLALVALSTQPLNAQQSANGLSAAREVGVAARALSAVTVPTAGPWQEFQFGGTGSFAFACGGCAPSSGGNSVFAGSPPWTFNAPAEGALLTVTDAFLDGDVFEIFDNNASIGVTSTPATTGSCGDDPDPCLLDPQVSHGVFWVAPGAHSLTIKAIASPFGGGAAYFKLDSPQADHYLCYDVKGRLPRRRKVEVSDQFGKGVYWVLRPRLLCVPAKKKHLD